MVFWSTWSWFECFTENITINKEYYSCPLLVLDFWKIPSTQITIKWTKKPSFYWFKGAIWGYAKVNRDISIVLRNEHLRTFMSFPIQIHVTKSSSKSISLAYTPEFSLRERCLSMVLPIPQCWIFETVITLGNVLRCLSWTFEVYHFWVSIFGN